jgi:hypothetical protein
MEEMMHRDEGDEECESGKREKGCPVNGKGSEHFRGKISMTSHDEWNPKDPSLAFLFSR